MWLNVLIFNLFFSYILLYLKCYDKLQKKSNKIAQPFTSKPKVWQLILAYIFRYSYLLTLLAMFLLGFSNPTLINLILVALFLIFFSRGDNLIVVKKVKDGNEKLSLTTFCKHYWLVIVYYTLICILAKYIYFLFFPDFRSLLFVGTDVTLVLAHL